ncbi:MAG TPA: 2-C-methyl-D-erythritol 2,4-cyclodiphosphate synthase [Ignavibacteriaceae bacterium]|nr:2-C-methyl-D-erythritol 2,4-cyclodiphosphate synthase [Ignavibacteriaceae bacterium]
MEYRTGIGFDVHAFQEGRKLFLGGVEIPFEKGLAGHSDADVLLHAICDAMLGALALGDIGIHFPNTDPKYKDSDSKVLLSEVYKLISEKDFKVGNIDSFLAIEAPKISPYANKMRETISSILNISTDQISIKATTTEKLGFIGRGEGVSAFATVLLEKV